jgi:hypothetical protein
MHSERLLRLADYMERVDPRNYNQRAWLAWTKADSVERTPTDNSPDEIVIKEGACGTTRCVLGHAVVAIPEAQLWFQHPTSSSDSVMIAVRDPETDELHYDYDAAAFVFDISEDHASVLFGSHAHDDTYRFYADRLPSGYTYAAGEIEFHKLVTPATVARKLREYVETDGASAHCFTGNE